MAATPSPLPPPANPQRRTIPFDYSFTFELTGQPDRIAVAKVEVSVEASFVATAIGYGFRPKVERIVFGGTRSDFAPLRAGQPPGEGVIAGASASAPLSAKAPAVALDHISLQKVLDLAARRLGESQQRARSGIGAQTAAVLEAGVRLNPEVARQVLLGASLDPIDDSLLPRLFEIVPLPPEDIQFLYAISDAGSGREFQSEPLLNTAGLGDPRGVRPFRQFAVPIVFEPRTTIRMQITELQTTKGALHVSLHGYKVLGGAGTPTGATGAAQPPGAGPARATRRSRR